MVIGNSRRKTWFNKKIRKGRMKGAGRNINRQKRGASDDTKKKRVEMWSEWQIKNTLNSTMKNK